MLSQNCAKMQEILILEILCIFRTHLFISTDDVGSRTRLAALNRLYLLIFVTRCLLALPHAEASLWPTMQVSTVPDHAHELSLRTARLLGATARDFCT